ncbi:MAG: hypothetical protein ACYTFY_15340, partial [Planctomycetota bacterium]
MVISENKRKAVNISLGIFIVAVMIFNVCRFKENAEPQNSSAENAEITVTADTASTAVEDSTLPNEKTVKAIAGNALSEKKVDTTDTKQTAAPQELTFFAADTRAKPIKWTSRTPAAKKAYQIKMNDEVVNATPATIKTEDKITFSLSEDTTCTGTVQSVSSDVNGTTQITAVVEGEEEDGYIYISTNQGKLMATVELPEEETNYVVTKDNSSELYNVVEVDMENSDHIACDCSNLEAHTHGDALAAPTADTIEGSEVSAPLGEGTADT